MTVILLSGGLDSTTLLTLAVRQQGGRNVHALGVLYGQRHDKELKSARKVAQKLDVPYTEVDLRDLRNLWTGSSQTDSSVPVPHGHYAAESMKATVVPNRNLTLLSVAAGFALSLTPPDSQRQVVVGYAAHAGDHAIYPDCRPEFVQAAEMVLKLVDYREVQLWAPFLSHSKADIVWLAQDVEAPLADTWSCYEGGDLHCGKCGTCVERREAFVLAGCSDPTRYRD